MDPRRPKTDKAPARREDEDREGCSPVDREELSPDDFDIDNAREKGRPHLDHGR